MIFEYGELKSCADCRFWVYNRDYCTLHHTPTVGAYYCLDWKPNYDVLHRGDE